MIYIYIYFSVAKEVDNGLIAIGLAAEPTEEAACRNQSAEGIPSFIFHNILCL